MTKLDFIFMLVRSGLWHTHLDHFDMNPWEYKEVMVEGEKQCVSGLITDCLKGNNMGLQKKCVIHMMKLQNALEKKNKNLEDNVAKLARLFNDHNIDYVVVKGQTIAAFYPNPRHRVPGDIDFYIQLKDFDNVKSLLKNEWGVEIIDKSLYAQPKHLDFKYNNNEFEMHFHLALFSHPKHQRLFDSLVNDTPRSKITIGGEEVCILSPTLNVFYTFVHLFQHLRKLGVALRQLCDLAILLNHYHDDIDRKQLVDILKQFDYQNAFTAFGSILVDKLGLPEQHFPLPITEKDRKRGNVILGDIVEYGNWGKYSRDVKKEISIKHSIQTACTLFSRYFKYYSLSPTENRAFVLYDVPKLFVGSVNDKVRRWCKG